MPSIHSIFGWKLIESTFSKGKNKVALLFHLFLFCSFGILFLPLSHNIFFLVAALPLSLLMLTGPSISFRHLLHWFNFNESLTLLPLWLEKRHFFQNYLLHLLEYLSPPSDGNTVTLRTDSSSSFIADSVSCTAQKTIFPKSWNIMESSESPSKYYLSINFFAKKNTVFPVTEKLKTKTFQ